MNEPDAIQEMADKTASQLKDYTYEAQNMFVHYLIKGIQKQRQRDKEDAETLIKSISQSNSDLNGLIGKATN